MEYYCNRHNTLDMGINSLNTKSVMIQVIDLLLKFLQDSCIENGIIRVERIIKVVYNSPYELVFESKDTIVTFYLDEGLKEFWKFENKELAIDAYKRILEQLQDKKVIQPIK